MPGFLLVDKPEDWTSHDVVGYLRGVTGIKKIGHAGTLDPFATGLLIVGVERAATKRLDEFKGMKKTYTATIFLGATSNTQDKTGTLTEQTVDHIPTQEDVQSVIQQFVGPQQQTPPMFSAKKVKGQKLYELARKGEAIHRDPVEITIYDIVLHNYSWPRIDITATVSTGTYIRTLAHDIGAALGTGGYCEELRRTHIGEFDVAKAKGPKEFDRVHWREDLFDGEK